MKNVALGGAHTPESISADEEPTLMNDAQPCFLARCRERVESAASTSFSGDGSVAPIVLWLIIGLAAVLRFAYLGAKSIWSDEAFSIVMAQLPWSDFRSEGSVAPIVLWLIIGLAAVLRFAYLGAKSIWSDEAFSIVMAQLPWSDFWRMTTT